MNLKPKVVLTEAEVQRGMKMVIWDGLASEVVTSFTGGAFLVAMALLLGANNVQIGLLASLPLITNLAQLLSIVLVRKFNNRRALSVCCLVLSRIPLIVIGITIWTVTDPSIDILIFFLFFHFLFGSISGPSWNAWMKDMVPEKILGEYFSRRSRYTQTLNVVLSMLLALTLDFIKSRHQEWELFTYATLFVLAGAVGLVGVSLLSRAPEPQAYLSNAKLFTLFKRPLANQNFRHMLVFNSAWVFALNIATPFFTVFMLQGLGMSLSYIILLTIVSQLFSILTLRTWGIFTDRYSNKSIISIAAPIYILCIVAWSFVGIYSRWYANMVLLTVIHVFTGIATAGINLSLTNIGLKLAPKEDAVVYLSVKNIVTSAFSALGPLIGGVLADFFADRRLEITFEWTSPNLDEVLRLVSLHQWNFLFLIGAFLALLSLQLLSQVREVGEVDKDVVKRIMRTRFKSNIKDTFFIGNIINWHSQLKAILKWKRNALSSTVRPVNYIRQNSNKKDSAE